MRSLRRLLGAAALLAGAAVPLALGPSPTPASAAGACAPQGVTVVVDFGALGGGVQRTCASGGGTAATLLGGHSLTRVQSDPGAVCSVDGKPAQTCPRMPPANAYWALFWSDGTSSHWTYASLGVDALRVPAGGSVALAWQSAAGNRAPAVAAPVTKTAAPAKKPAKKSAKAGTPKSAKPAAKEPATKPATRPSATPTASASPSVSAGVSPSAVAAKPTAKAKKRPRATASVAPSAPAGSPTATASAAAPTASATTSADAVPTAAHAGSGLPGWVAPGVVVVVLAAGGGVVARRRLRG